MASFTLRKNTGSILFMSLLLALFHLPSQAQKKKLSIFFDFNTSVLQQPSKDSMAICLERLEKNKYTVTHVNIFGYCDSIGKTDYNQELSMQRAEAVKQFLVSEKNISVPIIVQGFGKDKPAYSNIEEDERAKNRRVDIIFVLQKAAPPPPVKVKKDTVKSELRKAIDTIKVGENIRLKNINFEPNTPVLLEASNSAVKELIKIMKDNPTLEIEIEGHICCGSEPDDENNLSTRRAKTIYQMLIDNDIDESRMTYKGYGRTRPLTQERDAMEQKLNRRVEIKILKK